MLSLFPPSLSLSLALFLSISLSLSPSPSLSRSENIFGCFDFNILGYFYTQRCLLETFFIQNLQNSKNVNFFFLIMFHFFRVDGDAGMFIFEQQSSLLFTASHSLSPSVPHTHTDTPTHTHTDTPTHTHTHTPTHPHTLTPTHSHTLTHPHSLDSGPQKRNFLLFLEVGFSQWKNQRLLSIE